MPRVAILGWGSLLWRRQDLQVSGHWRSDGPWLPIEFARTSDLACKKGNPYLSLVIHPNSQLIRTYRDVSLLTERAEDVVYDLRKREGCTASCIAFLPREIQSQSSVPGVDGRIREWLDSKRNEVDAVVWTNLAPKLGQKNVFNVQEGIEWLESLRESNQHGTAEEYVRKAPSQSDTCLRRQLRERFEWADIPIGF